MQRTVQRDHKLDYISTVGTKVIQDIEHKNNLLYAIKVITFNELDAIGSKMFPRRWIRCHWGERVR